MPNPIRYMYFIIKHQINIQLLSVLFHNITVVLYIVISISMKAGFFLWILPLTFLFRNLHWIWQEMNVTDNMQMLKENGYKAPKSVSTEDSIMANIQWTGYSSNRLQNVYRMSTECLQRYAVQSSDQTYTFPENDVPTYPSTKTYTVSVLPKYDTMARKHTSI